MLPKRSTTHCTVRYDDFPFLSLRITSRLLLLVGKSWLNCLDVPVYGARFGQDAIT